MKNRINSHDPTPQALQGHLLVASRGLEGTPFGRTVILILQQNDEGIFGVILNRAADSKIAAEWQKNVNSPQHVLEHLYCGGPLGGPVFAVHHDNNLGEIQVSDDLFVSTSTESLDRLFVGPEQPYRVFLGLAGWKLDQLKGELQRGLWYLLDRDELDVVEATDRLWERCLLRYGRSRLWEILGCEEIPANPNLN